MDPQNTSLDSPEATDAGRKLFSIAGHAFGAPSLAPGLYVVATPIGNLRDITLRALETLAAAERVLCEDTRVSRKLLNHYGINTPTTAYHDFNAASVRPWVLDRLQKGAAMALISDAGTPLVSDPGYKLVREAREHGIPVFAIPGASALLAGLVSSALPTDRVFFEGFLPAKAGARRERIAELRLIPATIVLFESGPRLPDTLAELLSGLGPRQAAICRELTKMYEEVRRGDFSELIASYRDDPEVRGEIVIVVEPPAAPTPPDEEAIEHALRAALTHLSVKDAASEVSKELGAPRREIYQRALLLAKGGE